ncbi:rho GTPase-activating protein 7-like isoform X1 [Hibiscus syriacus]|uniref:Rho GTPase-activating protein 7-like isoform X1 n=1 Tax=Hibiscus syriacus TaxID=106335 RepID=A0A6A2YT42_HIBSY|nr:rho GTPase-activating protein 7-like isoform X1 [Hibiscus syriacus]
MAVNSQTKTTNSSISAEVVLLDRKISESQVVLDPVEYSRIEFPDINVVRENQQMVSQNFNGLNPRPGIASFLQLGLVEDYEMTVNSSEEVHGGSLSPNGSLQNSGFSSSTTTSLSDDRNSADSNEKKSRLAGKPSNSLTPETNPSPGGCPSNRGCEVGEEKESSYSSKEVFSAPLGNMNLEAEQSAMQQQIVDMYMRSMQQYTESLAKMKLPMDLDKPEHEHRGNFIQNNSKKIEQEKKKDGSRVFYGSRAFF